MLLRGLGAPTTPSPYKILGNIWGAEFPLLSMYREMPGTLIKPQGNYGESIVFARFWGTVEGVS